MKDEQPIPSPHSQSEISKASAGLDWNDQVTRKSFLKRTGGATLQTILNLHAASRASLALPSQTGIGGRSGVSVSIPNLDLGIDKYGYRKESQVFSTKYEWIHPVPNEPMTLPHDQPDAQGQAPPNQLTISAQMSDPKAVVSFRLSGDEPNCISIVKTVNEGNGVVKITIKALKPSTPIMTVNGLQRRPKGTTIEAIHKGNVVGLGKFYVLQPKYIEKGKKGDIIKDIKSMQAEKPGRIHWAEWEGQPVSLTLPTGVDPPARKTYAKSYIQTVQVRVLDQYKKPLESPYAEAGVGVEEDGNWIAWYQKGFYDDPLGPSNGDVIFPTEEKITEFGVSVAGHEIGTIRRRLSISNDNGNNADYKLTWD